MSSRARLGLAVLGLLLAPLATHGLAADWSFEPVVDLGAEHTDNVLVSSAAPAESDTAWRAALTLALRGVTPRSETLLSYRPAREIYDEFSELDHTSHDAFVRWETQASRRLDLTFDAGWTRREQARVLFDAPQLDLVALPRTRFEALRGLFESELRAGRTSAFNFSARHVRNSYEQQEVPSGETSLTLGDTSSTTLGLGYDYLFSERKRLGTTLEATRIDEGFRGEVDTYRLLGVYRWEGRRELSVTLRVGAGQTSVREPGLGPGGEPLPDIDEQTFFVGGIDLSGPVGRRSTLTGGISRDVTGGAGVSSTAETLSGFLAWDFRLRRYSGLSVFARYTQRDTLDRIEGGAEPFPGIDTTSYRAEWRGALSRTWRLVVAGERFDQSSDEASLEVDYTIYSASLRWAPAAGRR
jgi:hypothetical protein